jgi:hypothetical protein
MTPVVVSGTVPGQDGLEPGGCGQQAPEALASARRTDGRAGPADAAGTSLQARGVMSRTLTWMAAAVLAAAVAAASAGCGHPQEQVLAGARPLPDPAWPLAHLDCSGPVRILGATQLQEAYGIPAMPKAGSPRAGTVIAGILPYEASPQLAHDLAVYSRRYGFPAARLMACLLDLPVPVGAL